MGDVRIHATVDRNADSDEVATELRRRLKGISEVAHVDTRVEHPRLGPAEILAAVAFAATVVKNIDTIAEAPATVVKGVRDLLQQVRGLIADIRGVHDVSVEIGAKRVPISQLTDEQLLDLARAARPAARKVEPTSGG